MTRRRVRAAALAALAAALLAGCADGGGGTQAPQQVPTTPAPADRAVYVALGGDESLGFELDDPLRDAWPQQVFNRAFDIDAAFVNLASPGATAADVRDSQVPAALELAPSTVTIWVGSADARAGTPPGAVAAGVGDAVAGLVDGGVGEVVVVVPRGVQDDVLTAAIADAAEAAGALVVPVEVDTPDLADETTQARVAATVAARLGA